MTSEQDANPTHDGDDVAALIRDFRVHLEHLHRIRDLAYLPSLPRAPEVAASSARHVAAGEAQTSSGLPNAGAAPGCVTATAEAREVKRTELREEASQWSAARKLEYLRIRNLGDCQRCALARTRTNIVFGVGDPDARLMFVGEAPGADEDRRGEPFVGRAGQRLTQWLGALGLTRGDVYIANVLKCRPPNNRDPNVEEVEACSPFLRAQIRAIEPRVLIALGRHAGMLLSGREDMPLKAMRAAPLVYRDPRGTEVPLVVTYHPSYVLRQEGPQKHDDAEFVPGAVDALVLADLRRAITLSARSESTEQE